MRAHAMTDVPYRARARKTTAPWHRREDACKGAQEAKTGLLLMAHALMHDLKLASSRTPAVHILASIAIARILYPRSHIIASIQGMHGASYHVQVYEYRVSAVG